MTSTTLHNAILVSDQEFWKKEVVEKKKFHYSYHTKSPSPKRSHSRNRS